MPEGGGAGRAGRAAAGTTLSGGIIADHPKQTLQPDKQSGLAACNKVMLIFVRVTIPNYCKTDLAITFLAK